MLQAFEALATRIRTIVAVLFGRLAASTVTPSLALAAAGSGSHLAVTFVSNAPSPATGDGIPAGWGTLRSGGSARVFSWGGSALDRELTQADSAARTPATSEYPAAGLVASETWAGVAGTIGGSSNDRCPGDAVLSDQRGPAIVGEHQVSDGGGVAHAKNGSCVGPSVRGNRHYVLRGRIWKGVSLCDTA